MVAVVQRLDARSFFFRPQLSVGTVGARPRGIPESF